MKLTEWRGTLEMIRGMTWILDRSTWCLKDEEVDMYFVECRYPEPEEEPEVPPVTEAEIRAGFLKALELLEAETEGDACDELKALRKLRDRLLVEVK